MDSSMKVAIKMARLSREEGGIPIGSVLVLNGEVIGKGHNQRIQKQSVILHGEMDALENAGRRSADEYRKCTLYTTLSPCSMCAGAILLYGIKKVVVGENVNFTGEIELLKKSGVEVILLQDQECINMMREYIRGNPNEWNEDIGN